MADTQRTTSQLQALMADNTSGEISPQDLRDLVVSAYNRLDDALATVAQLDAAVASLNASNLTTGTVPDARLSSNVALENTANTFTAQQTITAPTANTVPLIVRGAASHAVNLQDWRNSGNTSLATISPNGTFTGAAVAVPTVACGRVQNSGLLTIKPEANNDGAGYGLVVQAGDTSSTDTGGPLTVAAGDNLTGLGGGGSLTLRAGNAFSSPGGVTIMGGTGEAVSGPVDISAGGFANINLVCAGLTINSNTGYTGGINGANFVNGICIGSV